MKTIIAAALIAASLVAPTILVATPAAAAQCGVDAPAEWERPGGFCDQKANLNTLAIAQGDSQKPVVPDDDDVYNDMYEGPVYVL